MRRATRSHSRVTSFTKSPSPSSSKPSLIPASLGLDKLHSPAIQGAEPPQDVEMEDGPDELDLIGFQPSEDEVSTFFCTEIKF